MSRGRSAEPELVQLGGVSFRRPPPPPPNRFDRSRSAGPRTNGERVSRYLPPFDEDLPSPSEADHALINQHVNPYQEFPSLRRGFSHQRSQVGHPEPDEIKIRGEGDACAYYFWAITLFFFSLALINFIVLILIVAILGIGPDGLSSVEFLPNDGSIKFLKDIWAPDITLSGVISGYADEPMTIQTENGDILFQVMDKSNTKNLPELRIGKSEISLLNVDSFQVVDPDSGKVIFDANSPEFYLDENEIDSLSVSEMETNRIVSPLDKDLLIQSDAGLDLIGTEGIEIESKTVTMDAGENISLESGSLTLDGEITIDPLALPLGGGGYPGEKQQYKLCICAPSGKLFTVPAVAQFKKINCQSMLPQWEKHPCDTA